MKSYLRSIGTFLVMGLVFYCGANSLAAQAVRDSSGPAAGQSSPLPLRRIVVFSSGLAYYEHGGTLNGQARLSLPFKTGAVNDVLKSLVINDPAAASPSVRYQSEQTLPQTLRSLSIDLSGEPDTAHILSTLRGAEVEIAAPSPVSGRILGVEYRSEAISPSGGETVEPWLSLYTAGGLRLFNLKEISSLSFKDRQLNEDLARALDLITAFRKQDSRDLLVTLPGSGSRQVSLSYVIPAPVWKVSYRLDLGTGGAARPLFQGWAIVDNDGDTDWNGVELSLVAGRPASFVQNLYPPYYLSRPVLPLAIAGTAAAAVHDSAYSSAGGSGESMKMARNSLAADELMEEPPEGSVYAARPPAPAPSVAGGAIQGAAGSAAGDQFEFTIKKPVSLDRRMSAMLPLVESGIEGHKLLIFSGAAQRGVNIHPRLGAEITNSTGMKLPAGPITVYDGGTYAGDALIEFWNEGEKRFISFGEDMSVNGTIMDTGSRAVTAVTLSGGVMTVSRSQSYHKTYTFKNAGDVSKQIMVEHPKTPGAALESPEADEQTPSAYRFTMTLPAGRELVIVVSEARPVSERISLLSLRSEAFLSYATNQEIPAAVRTALQRAVSLKREADEAGAAVTELENRRNSLVAEQDRIRKNLEAAGSQTQQGQEYLKRLVSLDGDIDRVTDDLEKSRTGAKAARKAHEDYLNGLSL
ncbi:MAG: DUF4139 domain-containing protein [Treponema sp.]|jgi:hypothetical protein|nr:DUF4139 domain-containing protein [Treponema sp.]